MYLRLLQCVQDWANLHVFDWPISWYFTLPSGLYVGLGVYLYWLCSRCTAALRREQWRMETAAVLVATLALLALTVCFPFTPAIFRRIPHIGLPALFTAVYACRLIALWRARSAILDTSLPNRNGENSAHSTS